MEKKRHYKGEVLEDGSFFAKRKVGKGNTEDEARITFPAFKALKSGKSVLLTIAKDGKSFTGEIV